MIDPPTFTQHIRVRPASEADLPILGALAGSLVRQHHAYDPQRFVLPRDVERGYREWFGRELGNAQAVILVAELASPRGAETEAEPEAEAETVGGYLYGRMEGRDWNLLLDRHAALHDIVVEPEARGHGVGEALVSRFLEIARERGLPRAVLHSASPNLGAQKLFARLGFRPTMVEMTCELGPESAPDEGPG